MSTTLYLSNHTLEREGWSGDTSAHIGAVSGHMQLTRTGVPQSAGIACTVGGGPNIGLRFISDPFGADITISGSVSYNIWAFESAMTVNASVGIQLFRLQPDGTVTAMGLTSNATELGTSAAVRTGSYTPTSTAFKAGDCLGVMVYAVAAGGTMALGSITVDTDAGSGGVDGDTFITITENPTLLDLTGPTNDPTGTECKFYDTPSDINPGAETELYLQLGGLNPSSFTKATNTVTGPTAPIQITDGGGGAVLAWYTPPLQAVTIPAGYITLAASWNQSSASAHCSFMFDLYKCNLDGSGETLLVRYWGNGNTTNNASEMQTTAGGEIYKIAFRETVLTAGQRLLVRFYIDDGMANACQAFGGTANGTIMASGFTATLTGGSSGNVQFGTTLVEQVLASSHVRPSNTRRLLPQLVR